MAEKFEIANVVGAARLNVPFLNLKHLIKLLHFSYSPRKFSGIVWWTFSPFKGHVQTYHNGKITVNGGTSAEENKMLAERLLSDLRDVGYDLALTDYRTVNFIATVDFDRRLHLEKISKHLKLFYEPEIFHGLSYKMEGCTAVLFYNGKCNLLGCKSMESVKQSYEKLSHTLQLCSPR